MFPLRARAVTRLQHWLEWFLVSEHICIFVACYHRECLNHCVIVSSSSLAVQVHRKQFRVKRHRHGGPVRFCVSQCRHTDVRFWCSFWRSGLSIKAQQPFSSGVIKPHGRRNRWSVCTVLAYHLPITQAIMGPSSFLFFLMTGSYHPPAKKILLTVRVIFIR